MTTGGEEQVLSDELREGDIVVVRAGEIIPGDGEVIGGDATVDESAITGESAPVVREAGGDRSGVTGGTRVLSDGIKIRITAGAGESFLDRMIALVEGAVAAENAQRAGADRDPGRADPCLPDGDRRPVADRRAISASGLPIPTSIALLVCLIPTTIGALLAAIGLAGMDRALSANVLAKSGKAVELAGDIDTLLLDKTGTITMGNRQATELSSAGRSVPRSELAEAAMCASFGDQTPEGRSIVDLGEETLGAGHAPIRRTPAVISLSAPNPLERPGSARTAAPTARGLRRRSDRHPAPRRRHPCRDLQGLVDGVARAGSTPIVVAEGTRSWGWSRFRTCSSPASGTGLSACAPWGCGWSW